MKILKKSFSKFTALLIVTVVAGSAYSFLYNDYRAMAYVYNKITQPLLYVQATLADKIQAGFAYVHNQQSLLEQLAYKEQMCLDLQAQLIALQAENVFTLDVNELAEYRKNYEFVDAKLARILLRNIDTCEHSYYVDGGLDKNIKIDSPVIYKNCLVGRVTQVYPTYSKVMLITDQHCKVAVICANTKTTGIYTGIGEKDAGALQYVSHMQQLEVGDMLLCAGEGLIYPYGFCVGKIASFEQNSIEYKVCVTPVLDLTQIKYCYIISGRDAASGEVNISSNSAA